MNLVQSIIEVLLLVIALSIDAFISSFAYGTKRIKIPLKSVLVINIVCRVILGVSLFLGAFISPFIHKEFTKGISFIIIFLLGLMKLFDKTVEVEAGVDSSKILSEIEAIYLAVALSIDSLVVGFGAGLSTINYIHVLVFSFIADMIAVMLGCFLGNKVTEKLNLNISWLSGIILIVLAFLKL